MVFNYDLKVYSNGVMSRDEITLVSLDKPLFLDTSGLAWLAKGLGVELNNLGSLT